MPPNHSRVVNRKSCAVSIVRPIEAIKPPKIGDEIKNIILKPKPNPNKNLPGTKLLIKLAKDRQKNKDRQKVKEIENQYKSQSNIDYNMINDIIDNIIQDLE